MVTVLELMLSRRKRDDTRYLFSRLCLPIDDSNSDESDSEIEATEDEETIDKEKYRSKWDRDRSLERLC